MNIEKYLGNRQISRQWADFLYSVARELEAQLDLQQLQYLMRATGTRMASNFPGPETDSLASVEELINQIWMECDWGWVSLNDAGDRISIEHHFSPLNIIFGEESVVWSSCLLEGFYASIFNQLGAGSELIVRIADEQPDNGNILLFEVCARE